MSSGSINVTGTYAMLTTGTPACLQFMSDAVVNATYVIAAFLSWKLHTLCMYHLAVPNQTIPIWVQHLPEPERSEKIAFIRQYGSPNVFTQFQPHVTLACDANATALSAAFAQKHRRYGVDGRRLQLPLDRLGLAARYAVYVYVHAVVG